MVSRDETDTHVFVTTVGETGLPCFSRVAKNIDKIEADESAESVLEQGEQSKGVMELVLDHGALAEEHGRPADSYCDLGMFRISLCGGLLAYTVDLDGEEQHACVIKVIASGTVLEVIPGPVSSIEWVRIHGENALAYTEVGEDGRPFRVRLRSVGAISDPVLYEEHDPAFLVDLALTKDHFSCDQG